MSGVLLAGTISVPTAHAAVPVDEAGLANALFGATMRMVNRDDDLAKNLVASAELLDWRAKNAQADAATVTAHLAAVRKHIDVAVPSQAWSREPVETVSAALAAVRGAPGATIDGARMGKLNNTLLGLDTVPVSTKPEDRVSGAQREFAWEAGFADNQAEVWTGVAQTARADASFRGAWNAEIGDRARVNSGAGATELGQGEQLRTVLDVSKLQNAAKLGEVQLREASTDVFKDLTTRLYNERKEKLDHLSNAAKRNPPDAKPTEPTEAQKTAAKAEEEKRKGYIDTVKGGLDGLAFVVGLIDKDFSKRISKFAEGAVKVAYAVNKAYTALTLVNSAFSLATAAFTGNLISVVSTLVSVFTAGGPTVEQLILDQIKELRKQLEQVQQNMNDRFDKVDAKLDNMYNRMLEEFRKLENGVVWVRENQKQILAALTSLSTELQVVGSTLLKAVAGLYKLDKWGKIDRFLDYKRKHAGRDMPESDFINAESDFWVTAVQAPTNELFVVPEANHRTDTATVLTNLNLHGDGGSAAFLAYYANAALGADLTTTGHGGNAAVWGIGASSYGLLLKQNPQWVNGTETKERGKAVLKEGRDIRDQLLSFSQPGPNGATNKIFQTLLANHGAKADQLIAEVAKREGEVSEGKTLSLFRGPEQGAPPGTPSLYAPSVFEPCTPSSDPARNFTLSRSRAHDGQHMTAPTQFYRYFRGDKFQYKPCWSFTHRPVAGQPNTYDLIIEMRDEFVFPDGTRWSSKRTSAVVHRWAPGSSADVPMFIKAQWDSKLKPIFDRDAKLEDGIDFLTPRFTKLAEEVLKEKRIDFYKRAATFVKDSAEGRELNLSARLLRAYTEAGFPRALNTDEYLRSALFGPKPLYGVNASDNGYLVAEYEMAAANVHNNNPPWDVTRSDRQVNCVGTATAEGKDAVGACLRDNMRSRQERLTDRLTEQFKQRWEGADQTLPGLQTQLRTLWLTLRSVHANYDFGPAIEAPAPPAPAAGIWTEPEAVDHEAAFESGVATTTFKGNQFVSWRGTDGHLYGALANSRGFPAKVKIADVVSKAPFAPTAAEFNGKLVVVWKDFRPGASWPTQNTAVSEDGKSWSVTSVPAPRRQLHNLDSPTLAVFNGKLLGLYRGTDQQLYLTSTTDAVTWGPAELILSGNMTNQRPGMTVHNGKLYAAWRGHDQHPRAYMASSVDGVNWVAAPARVGGLDAGIDGGPALASHGGKLYAVWRGAWGDPTMYGAFTTDGAEWSPQYSVARTVKTNHAPSVTVLGGRLRLAWGPPNDLFQGNTVAVASSAVLTG
ncbi:sialidase family protein [Allokutzneria oryzae]|uniref:Sialidase family protein n=1 Tax=Allokutzneria oryzae TaxID=1378989 RepID=A0ABV6A3W9_9PSEU